jgi:hypothetical protein
LILVLVDFFKNVFETNAFLATENDRCKLDCRSRSPETCPVLDPTLLVDICSRGKQLQNNLG